MRIARVYVDTSVFSGIKDKEFAKPSLQFLADVRKGKYVVLVSEVVLDELMPAPPSVKNALTSLPQHSVERVELSTDVQQLADAYIAAGVLTESSKDDALHVALATVARADLIVSWNFKHIVNFRRIQLYNSVNLANGYGMIDVRSPLEVANDDQD